MSFRSRKTILAALLAAGLILGIGGTLLGIALHEPAFYTRGFNCERSELVIGNDQLLARVSALAGDTQHDGTWHAVFSENEVNGWMAIDVPRNHASLLPEGVEAPRISMHADCVDIGFRQAVGPWQPVISLRVDVHSPAPNQLALRVRRMRAGGIPLPLKGVLDALSNAAETYRLKVQWSQSESTPMALIEFVPTADQYIIEHVELREGEIYVAGRTTTREAPASDQPSAVPRVASDSAENPTSQR